MYDDIVEKMIKKAIQSRVIEPCDYINADGLLMCGKCHTPRGEYRNYSGVRKEVPIMCRCREEAYKKAMEEKEIQENEKVICWLKKKSMIDDKFINARYNPDFNAENRSAIVKCQRYANNFEDNYAKNQGLLLYGTNGTGKSYAAASICNEVIEKFLSEAVMLSTVSFVENSLSSDYDYLNERYHHLVEKPKLLVIDDLGAERDSAFGQETVYYLVNSRYLAKKPMVVTTNLTIGEMRCCTDLRKKRIYERIYETCYPIEFKGKSLRIVEAARRYDELTKEYEES